MADSLHWRVVDNENKSAAIAKRDLKIDRSHWRSLSQGCSM